MKHTIRNPEKWIGKVVDSTKWNIPAGYEKCAMTGKLYPESQLSITFAHWVFDRGFRIQHHINIYDADWLSEEGYNRIMLKLQSLGLEDDYHEAATFSMTLTEYRDSRKITAPGDLLPEPGDEIEIRGKNGELYEGAYLDSDDTKVLCRVWDWEVRSWYCAWWGYSAVVSIDGKKVL